MTLENVVHINHFHLETAILYVKGHFITRTIVLNEENQLHLVNSNIIFRRKWKIYYNFLKPYTEMKDHNSNYTRVPPSHPFSQ